VHLVALGKEEFCEIGAVLAGDTGDECAFHGREREWGNEGVSSEEVGKVSEDGKLKAELLRRMAECGRRKQERSGS
jgi:hypothetical protein